LSALRDGLYNQCVSLHESVTLAEVAFQVGFADQGHLGWHCKRLLGVTPKMLVKQRKNLPDLTA
jgi:AraC family transcriptional regulator